MGGFGWGPKGLRRESLCAFLVPYTRKVSEPLPEILYAELLRVFFLYLILVSRGRCGCKIAPLRRLAAVVAASFLRFFKRVESTPDPNTSEKYRDTPPISIAILLQKYALLSAESTNIHHQFVSRYASHLYRDTFAEVLGSGVVGTPPNFEVNPQNR